MIIPFDPRPLLRDERAAMVDLLRSLADDDWARPTPCPGWSVHDLALHLIADDIGILAWRRDGWADPAFGSGLDLATWPGLVGAIDRHNAVWLVGARRISPALAVELLAWTGGRADAWLAGRDLAAIGRPVSWAGPEPAPVWLDLAREYTERWVHQQHIREAVGRPGLDDARWFGPLFATFVQALPHALRDADAPEGRQVVVEVTGPGGGVWVATRRQTGWRLGESRAGAPLARVALPGAVVWRLWTRGMSPEAGRATSNVEGDATLADRVFGMTAIIG
jgi:uncharacterized protein (TIGR03083 family)